MTSTSCDKIKPIYLVTVYDEEAFVFLSKERAERARKIIKNTLTSSPYIKYEDNYDCHGNEVDIDELNQDDLKITEIKEGENIQKYLNSNHAWNDLRFEKDIAEEALAKHKLRSKKQKELEDLKDKALKFEALNQIHLCQPGIQTNRTRTYSLCTAEEYSKILQTYGGIEYQIHSKHFKRLQNN